MGWGTTAILETYPCRDGRSTEHRPTPLVTLTSFSVPDLNDDAPRFRVAHISDIHFGKISHPDVVPALISEVNEGDFDLVVISGDITQRARQREWEPAQEMMEAMIPPLVVIPGNHDVPPWWKPASRLFRHRAPFRHYVSRDTTPSFEADIEGLRLAVFGMDSTRGLAIANGTIYARQVTAMERFFAAQPEDAFRILTVHHPLKQVRALAPYPLPHGASRAFRRAAHAGVELILSGHLHRSHVAHVEVKAAEGHRVAIASAGTATSSRGRLENRGINFYNAVSVWPDRFSVEERRFEPMHNRFVRERRHAFERSLSGVEEA